MQLRTFITTTSAVAALVAPAAAQAQAGGDTGVGGDVHSFMELSLTQPAQGFAAFARAKSYEMSIVARATATDAPSSLSIADGDVVSGSKAGHLTIGAKRLSAPLEAAVGKGAFMPLGSSVDPLLVRWSSITARATATVKLRQRVTAKRTGSYRKLVLVTLSSETP
ncbi:hypothetical protein OM076_21810 [Solirubrobacter ginsenosidimutans]|uniref:Uncharacterized protein n=1 Tax=Solirubrobacter ginsenosidimutans TaxID=490573 RepID=A0A9X3MUL8_9ACTN|nr:hypothetical protein [Solirubrobacter ginsenosidimutans]MDA0162924.1 hypothetical protein [Solirubrobacter ginsenosidimutans]